METSPQALTEISLRRWREATPMLPRAPLVLVASPDAATADAAAERLRASGAVAYAAHSWRGALRVATALGPDLVLLDPALPPRLASLMRAHPTSARATILNLADAAGSRAAGSSGGTYRSPLPAAA